MVGGNPGHTAFEIRHMLSTCNVKLIITEPQLLEKVQKAAEECSSRPLIYLYSNACSTDEESIKPWNDLLQHGETDWIRLTAAEANVEAAAYFATSGTTGSPKYAAVSHGYFIHGGMNIKADVSNKPYLVSRLISLPLMHAFAAPLVIVGALHCGTPTYLMARFATREFLEIISNLGISEVPVVPSMLSALLAYPEFDAEKLGSLREIMSAGAPLSRSLAIRFGSVLHKQARLIQLYGLTEAGWIASVPFLREEKVEGEDSTTPPLPLDRDQIESDSETLAGSIECASTPETPTTSVSDFLNTSTPTIGTALPGYSLALRDPETHQIISAPDTLGEILIEAPHPFLYYLRAPEATEAAFTEISDAVMDTKKPRRLIKSGDIAYFDGEGDFFIVDRLKDLIKVRGWQVSPAEIEGVLLQHPGVADAAAIGRPDEDGVSGELPHAFVVMAEKQPEVTEADLKRWIRGRLAAYKTPASVRFIEKVPRNPAGKILRRLLRDSN